MSALLLAKNLVRELGEQMVTRALDGVDLQVYRGEFLALTGQSGSGKSTLLYLLSALDRPTSGEIWFDDKNITAMNDDERASLRRERFGFVFQFHFLLPEFTSLENITIPLRHRGIDTKEAEERARGALGSLGIAELHARRPHQLSGGQQQRVSIARAIAGRPSIVFADEPTGNLDSHSAEATIRIFERLVADGMTLVMVTHEPAFAARANREVHLSDGRVYDDEATRPNVIYMPR